MTIPTRHDWPALKREYLHGDFVSVRAFARFKGINHIVVATNATGWSQERKALAERKSARTIERTLEKTVEAESDIMVRLLASAARLTTKLEEAVEQLDALTITKRKRTKKTKFDPETGKPNDETTTDYETLETAYTIIDRQGLRLLTAALKDIRDVAKDGGKSDDGDKADELIRAMEAGARAAIQR